MNLGAIFIGLSLAMVGMVTVFIPFRKRAAADDLRITPSGDTKSARQNLLQSLQALRFDHDLGQVNDQDYVLLQAELFSDVSRLTEKDGQEADDRLEALIRARKETVRVQKNTFCQRCGRPIGSEDRFCPECGSTTQAGCPACGEAVEENHRFCANCGHRLMEMEQT